MSAPENDSPLSRPLTRGDDRWPPAVLLLLFVGGAVVVGGALLVLTSLSTRPGCARVSACEPVAHRVLVALLFLAALPTLVGGAGIGAWLAHRDR